VFKYFDEIDHLTTFYESKTLSEANTKYRAHSFVYVSGEFGIVRKVADSSIVECYTLPYLEVKTATIDPNGLFTASDVADL